MARELPVPAMLRPYISHELRTNQEFQSSVVRLVLWGFMASFIGLAGWNDYYRLNWELFTLLFAAHLVWYTGVLVSVIRHPAPSVARRYLGMVADLSGVTFAIYLGGNALSPFYLFYIWIFISQGSRYGKEALKAASIGSVIAYSLVVTLMNGWMDHALDSVFLLMILVALPLYQYSLLRRLHEARQTAEAANQARGNFLATMTHELRTPLSGVIGMTRLLGSTRLDNEQREYVESLSASANMLQALIGDILDLSKIDARKLELRPESFDVRQCVVEVAGALADPALDKGVELITDVAGDVPSQIFGDQLRFRQVLFNLLGNAVKFTEQGHVRVQVQLAGPSVEVREPHLYIAVQDTGIGIPRHKQGKIFESFWQGDSGTTRRYGGTGLGTAIARDLTRLMKGDIGIESVEGRGSTFWIRVPLLGKGEHASLPPQPLGSLRGRTALLFETYSEQLTLMERVCRDAGMKCVSVDQADKLTRAVAEHVGPLDLMVLADNPRGLDLEGLAMLVSKLHGGTLPVVFLHYPRRRIPGLAANTMVLAKPFVAPDLWEAMALAIAADRLPVFRDEPVSLLNVVPAGKGARVLVAEDDSINAKLIQSLLRKAGHEVVLVRDGQQALEAAQAESFDLALVDLRMPRMDGIQFARTYRAQEEVGHLPIVALTANAAEDARAECLEAGMDDFLTKPVEPQQLDQLLRRFRGAHPA